MSLSADIQIITDNAIPTETKMLLQAIKLSLSLPNIFATFLSQLPLVRQDVHRLEMRVKAVVSAQTGLLGDW